MTNCCRKLTQREGKETGKDGRGNDDLYWASLFLGHRVCKCKVTFDHNLLIFASNMC